MKTNEEYIKQFFADEKDGQLPRLIHDVKQDTLDAVKITALENL
jgi:hypothetical protein